MKFEVQKDLGDPENPLHLRYFKLFIKNFLAISIKEWTECLQWYRQKNLHFFSPLVIGKEFL